MGTTAPIRNDAIAEPESLPVDRTTLAMLRVTGARCRVMARSSDAVEACALLHGGRAAETVAQVLLRVFSGEGGMPRLKLYQPGADDVSFDEAWLLSALAAADRQDHDSLTFLLARRLPKHARRPVGRLFVALAHALDVQDNLAA